MNQRRIFAAACLLFCSLMPAFAGDGAVDSLGVRKAVATSPAALLAGEHSGVRVSAIDGNPVGELNVYIRGLNTVRGTSQPLWIVDGVMMGTALNQNMEAFYMKGGLTSNGDKLPDYSGYSYTSPTGNFAWLNPYEIESIEVLKDLSETAAYGMSGANGVIVVRTRHSSPKTRRFYFSAGEGVDIPTQSGDAFGIGIRSMQEIGVIGSLGTDSYYNISGFLRHTGGAVKNTGSTVGGMSVSLETNSNALYQFGLHSHLSYGDYTSTCGTNYLGAPSVMMLSRYPDYFPKDNLSGYLKSYDDEILDYHTINSVWLRVNLFPFLYIKTAAGVDYQNQTRYLWYGSGTSFGKTFSGASSILNNSLFSYNFRGEVCFGRIIAHNHHLSANLAAIINGDINRTNAMCGTQFDVPFLRGKGLSSSASMHTIRKFARKDHLNAYSANLKYEYKRFFGIDGSVRFDRNHRFDASPILFPSVNAYLDLKNLLLADSGFVSALKIAGGYGKAGSETILPYEYLQGYISEVPVINPDAAFYYDGLGRIISGEYNVGIQTGLARGRINLSLKYYDKTTDDMFKVYDFGKVVGALYVEAKKCKVLQERTTSLRNNGFELDADIKPVDSRNWTWSLFGNAAYNINRVVSLDALDAQTPVLKNGFYTAVNREGLSIGQAYGYKTGTDKELVSFVPEALGNTIPKIVYGFGTTLRWTRLTLDARMSGAAGFNIVNANNLIRDALYYISSEDVEKGDYLRLDNVSLSYDIPCKAKWIKGLKVNIAGHNLLTLTSYSGWNPDVNCFGVTTRSYGVDYGSFPIIRSVVMGLSVKF